MRSGVAAVGHRPRQDTSSTRDLQRSGSRLHVRGRRYPGVRDFTVATPAVKALPPLQVSVRHQAGYGPEALAVGARPSRCGGSRRPATSSRPPLPSRLRWCSGEVRARVPRCAERDGAQLRPQAGGAAASKLPVTLGRAGCPPTWRSPPQERARPSASRHPWHSPTGRLPAPREPSRGEGGGPAGGTRPTGTGCRFSAASATVARGNAEVLSVRANARSTSRAAGQLRSDGLRVRPSPRSLCR